MKPRLHNQSAQDRHSWVRPQPIETGSSVPTIMLRMEDGQPRATGDAQAFIGCRQEFAGDSRPRGLFASWSWDGETLTAEVDPLGFFSLFVYSHGDCVGLSPSLLHLVAAGAETVVDPVAVAVFHRLGMFVNDDTPFRQIRTLPPGGRLRWKAGRLEITGGFLSPKTQSMSRSAAVEAFIELPRASLRRFLDHWAGQIALPLSGGRDSRHILFELHHQRRLPETCVTFHHGGRSLNAEVQAARAIAARVGVRHTVLGHPRARMRDQIRGLLLTQLCADEHAQMMPLHDFFNNQPVAALDGIGGDILTNPDNSAAGFMALSQKGDFSGIARGMMRGHADVLSRPGHEGGAGSLLSPDLHEAAVDRVARAVAQHADAPDPYQAFWFWHRTRREINFVPTAILASAAAVYCPYLDPDMVELGLSLPWSITCDQKLHDDAIARAFPDFADVPFSEGFVSQALPATRLHKVRSVVDSLAIALSVEPDRPLGAIADVLGGSPSQLKRSVADVYRLHGRLIAQMDAPGARRLISLGHRLASAAGDPVYEVIDAP
ncbi:MAG: hypothetical protein ACKVP4_02425 [Hyphomicrobium sp.]